MNKKFSESNTVLVTIPFVLLFIVAVGFIVLFNFFGTGNNSELNVVDPYPAKELTGISSWINSEPLKIDELKGKVVIIDFWTYSCINCIRTIPYLNDLHEKYADKGLVIIGVHSPEFAFERNKENVEKAVKDYEIKYPVALDNDFSTWQSYNNRYWPTHYFIDSKGFVRHIHFGEGEYYENEKVVQLLLSQIGNNEFDEPDNFGINPPINQMQSPEVYFGYGRHKNFSDQNNFTKDVPHRFSASEQLSPNEWTLNGLWQIDDESAQSLEKDSQLSINASAKDIYIVMGNDIENSKIKIKVDGEEDYYGEDVDENGYLEVDGYRLYKIVSFDEFKNNIVLEIEFDPGITIHTFTFGG